MIEPVEKLRKRARAAYKAEQFDSAAAYYQLLQQHPDITPSAPDYLEHALSLMRSDKGREAQAVLETAALRLPEDSSIRSRLAELLLRQGRTQAALDHFRAAAGLSPDAAEPHWRLSLIEASLGNRAEADAAIASCLAIDPDHPPARAAADLNRPRTPGAAVSPAPEIADAAFANLVDFIHKRPAEDPIPAAPVRRSAARPVLAALAGAIVFIVLYVWARSALL